MYDIIIAADEKNEMLGDDEEPAETGDAEDDTKKQSNEGEDEETEAKRPKKKAKKSKGGDKEYGVSRGTLNLARVQGYASREPMLTDLNRCRLQEGFRSYQLRSSHHSICLHT